MLPLSRPLMSKCVMKKGWAEKTTPGCNPSLTSRKPSTIQLEAKEKRGKESAEVNCTKIVINWVQLGYLILKKRHVLA